MIRRGVKIEIERRKRREESMEGEMGGVKKKSEVASHMQENRTSGETEDKKVNDLESQLGEDIGGSQGGERMNYWIDRGQR